MVNYCEWFAPTKIYGCQALPAISHHADNVSDENDVSRTNQSWRAFYRLADVDHYSKLMVRQSGSVYRIFADFVGYGGGANKLLQADINQNGIVTIISYDNQEFPEYQFGDIIVYDEEQSIDSDEGMMPQIWIDTPAVRTAWTSALNSKLAELWPGETFPELG